MQNTRTVNQIFNPRTQQPDSDTRNADLLQQVATVARGFGGLEYLVINCHGNPGVLLIAETFLTKDMVLFSALNRLVKQGIIITSCGVAHTPTADEVRKAPQISDGKLFCADMARYAGCRVYAAEENQHTVAGGKPNTPFLFPFGFIDYFEGTYYEFLPTGGNRINHNDPAHDSISEWEDFKSMQWWGSDKSERKVPTFGKQGWTDITTRGVGAWPADPSDNVGPWGF
jgi:hypothetical protein